MEILGWLKITKNRLGRAESLYLQREKKLKSDVNNRCPAAQNDRVECERIKDPRTPPL